MHHRVALAAMWSPGYLSGHSGSALPDVHLRDELPSVRARRAGDRMRLTDPAQLSAVLGIPFSEEQLSAIAAPLEPAVIIAGAGSGKTTVMAARVVWLVGSGQVRPEQVLGLTFTRKAAGELGSRIRRALLQAGVLEDAKRRVDLTYDAFAGRLVTEYGLMLGIEGDARMITGAASIGWRPGWWPTLPD